MSHEHPYRVMQIILYGIVAWTSVEDSFSISFVMAHNLQSIIPLFRWDQLLSEQVVPFSAIGALTSSLILVIKIHSFSARTSARCAVMNAAFLLDDLIEAQEAFRML